MKQYRIVEAYPPDGKRDTRPYTRTTIWRGPDRETLKSEIKTWCAQPERRPYAEISYYHGSKQIYAYEL